MEAMGYPAVMIETVGAGQGEIEIARCVHTTAMVVIPDIGDGLQAMKAGLLEIGDVFVVNKADCPGADETVRLMESMLGHRHCAADAWRPPVIKTVAVQNQGIGALVDLLFQHRRYLESTGRLAERRARNQTHFFRQLVLDMAARLLLQDSPELDCLQDELGRGLDPYTAAERFINRRLNKA
jgi:LAO/AO transport system kinase